MWMNGNIKTLLSNTRNLSYSAVYMLSTRLGNSILSLFLRLMFIRRQKLWLKGNRYFLFISSISYFKLNLSLLSSSTSTALLFYSSYSISTAYPSITRRFFRLIFWRSSFFNISSVITVFSSSFSFFSSTTRFLATIYITSAYRPESFIFKHNIINYSTLLLSHNSSGDTFSVLMLYSFKLIQSLNSQDIQLHTLTR